jgi:hypothetical protein
MVTVMGVSVRGRSTFPRGFSGQATGSEDTWAESASGVLASGVVVSSWTEAVSWTETDSATSAVEVVVLELVVPEPQAVSQLRAKVRAKARAGRRKFFFTCSTPFK